MDPPRRRPPLTQPWEDGVIGWVVVCGALLVVLVGGLVTNQMPMAIAAPVLVLPVAVAAGFAVVQWWQVRACGAERGELVARMTLPVTMEMTLVARFYERLGDHAVNIARRVIYLAGSSAR
jgi:PhoU domain-containing protein